MKNDNTSLLELTKHIVDFRDSRGWKKFHSPKNLASSIVLEAAELLEIFQWGNPSIESVMKNLDTMREVKTELADIVIYCLSLSERLKIDIAASVYQKIKHNRKKYPKKYFNKGLQDKNYYKRLKKRYRKEEINKLD